MSMSVPQIKINYFCIYMHFITKFVDRKNRVTENPKRNVQKS
jgi:hypothetical protein